MNNLLVFGIVLAFGALVVYLSRKIGVAESDLGHEKATSGASQKVADIKIESLNKTVLELDAETRAKERESERIAYEAEDDTLTRTRIGFYPRLHEDTDPNDLN